MDDLLGILKKYQAMAQASMPERALEDFMITVSWNKDVLKHFFKVREVGTDKFIRFSPYNPNVKLVGGTPQEAIRLMHLAIEDWGKKFTAPKKEKVVKERVPRSKLPKNRDKDADFVLLEAIFAGGDTPGYTDLLASIQEWFLVSQRKGRECLKHWIVNGMLVKEGPDRGPYTYYRLGTKI